MLKYALPFLIYPSGGLVLVGTLSTGLRIFISFINAAEFNALYFTGSNLFILFSFYRANIKIITKYINLLMKRNNRVSVLTSKVKNDDERKKEADAYFEQLKNAW
uniref:Uncharacterized protein n=1 Tax=Panagrolaimus davidi TaxID=227884 RepID=A0A914P163_9BILA